MKRLFAATLSGILGFSATAALGQVSITAPGQIYTQNFDTLASSGSGTWANNSTLTGWHLFNSANMAITNYTAGTGATNAGAFYSFGTSGSSERALGGVGSNNFSGWIALGLTNTTSAALDGFSLSFVGEQWRNGGNTAAQSMTLEYGYGASFASVSWTAPGGSFDWASPVASATAAAVDGNTAGLVADRGGSVTGANWAAGDTLWIRWTETNNAGNDHGLAIDNVSVTAGTVIPEPSTYAMIFGGLTLGLVALRRYRR